MTYKKLIDGFHIFQKDYYESEDNAFYKELAEHGQKPETLVIACSDSRIDPAILTQCDPGDLFAIRNVAALVPEYNNKRGLLRGTSSAIEYAVRHLEVKHIVILGHSGCGGVEALATGNFQATSNHSFQFLHHWLNIGTETKEGVFKTMTDVNEEERTCILGQALILNSLANLLSFPWIKDKCEREELQIHGWYFDLLKGKLLEYDPKEKLFDDIHHSEASAHFLKDKPALADFLKNYSGTCSCSCSCSS